MGDVHFSTFVWAAIGVAASIMLPFLAALVRKEFPRPVAGGTPPWVRPYALLALFSILAAIACIMYYTNDHPGPITMQRAFLIGFAWETLFEKMAQPPLGTTPRLASAGGVVGSLVVLAATIAVLGWALLGA